ncbi:cytochrome P450 78A9-like [Tripterygium wilfordii]|uniref:Cytochrome P450 78A9-like n=1 Tax=Tripterygium wilfordii TaxID=458696 RepID=A0A7J7CDM9_TRIWF|nr:cytochrome P450 78A9-like [Tripterygium wilfordii]
MVTIFGNKQENFGVRELIKRASLNNMMCSVFGREYELNSTSWEVEELKELVDEENPVKMWKPRTQSEQVRWQNYR